MMPIPPNFLENTCHGVMNIKRRQVLTRLKQITCKTDMTSIRILLVIAEFLWAITLYWPGDTFGRPTYNGMSDFATEIEWANIFFVSAIIQFLLIYKNDYTTKFSYAFAAWNSVLWLFVCGSMYLSVYPPPAAISGELSLAIGALWVFIRSGKDVR